MNVSTGASKKSWERRKAKYVLEHQIGFLLRQASQRHAALFAERVSDNITPQQLSALVKLLQNGTCWQTQLGRMTAMDVATMKGVVDRLIARQLVETKSDPEDGRRILVKLTRGGKTLAEKVLEDSIAIHSATLTPLSSKERKTLTALLSKLVSAEVDAS
jgi:DNA-binding MarR family transcriptional regulator